MSDELPNGFREFFQNPNKKDDSFTTTNQKFKFIQFPNGRTIRFGIATSRTLKEEGVEQEELDALLVADCGCVCKSPYELAMCASCGLIFCMRHSGQCEVCGLRSCVPCLSMIPTVLGEFVNVCRRCSTIMNEKWYTTLIKRFFRRKDK